MKPGRRQRGLATVLLLLALAGFVTAFILYNGLGRISKRMDATNSNVAAFAKIDDALTQYVMLNRRLPCPASGTAHTGDADPNSAVTTCNSPSGVVPWNTLGLSKADAVDGWGRYISFRVYDGASGFTRTNGMALPDCLDEETSAIYALSGAGSTCNPTTHENSISDFFATKGVTVNDMGTARTKVAYVLISHGESGLGGYYPGATAPLTAPSVSSKESLNAGSAGTYWITAPSAPSVTPSDAAHFDDVLSYAFGSDVARHARLAGRPWALSALVSQAALGVSGTNFNTLANPVKITTTQGPVMVTAAADTARVVCATKVGTNPTGVSPCLSSVTDGSDELTSTENERLTFDFRVTRKVAVFHFTDFKASAGGDNERSQITFYNAAGAQVDQRTVTACATSGGQRTGQYTITPSGDFTKVEIRALTRTGGSTSSFGVSAIMACKLVADCNTIPATWTAPNCVG